MGGSETTVAWDDHYQVFRLLQPNYVMGGVGCKACAAGARYATFIIFGDMTLVTYRRKSFSMREDDSCAPHSPHTMSIQQVRPFGLGGFGVSSFSQFNH